MIEQDLGIFCVSLTFTATTTDTKNRISSGTMTRSNRNVAPSRRQINPYIE